MVNYITISIYVDNETGEIISKQLTKRDYNIVKKTKSYDTTKVYENNGNKWGTIAITITNECEKNRQTKLF